MVGKHETIKEIEDHVKEIEGHVKHLKELREKLELDYDLDAVSEIQVVLKKLNKALDNLDEKLKNKDAIIAEVAKSPIYNISPFAYIKAMKDVENVFGKAEETIEEANKVIDGLNDAIVEFKKALSDPYTRKMIMDREMARARRYREMIEGHHSFMRLE